MIISRKTRIFLYLDCFKVISVSGSLRCRLEIELIKDKYDFVINGYKERNESGSHRKISISKASPNFVDKKDYYLSDHHLRYLSSPFTLTSIQEYIKLNEYIEISVIYPDEVENNYLSNIRINLYYIDDFPPNNANNSDNNSGEPRLTLICSNDIKFGVQNQFEIQCLPLIFHNNGLFVKLRGLFTLFQTETHFAGCDKIETLLFPHDDTKSDYKIYLDNQKSLSDKFTFYIKNIKDFINAYCSKCLPENEAYITENLLLPAIQKPSIMSFSSPTNYGNSIMKWLTYLNIQRLYIYYNVINYIYSQSNNIYNYLHYTYMDDVQQIWKMTFYIDLLDSHKDYYSNDLVISHYNISSKLFNQKLDNYLINNVHNTSFYLINKINSIIYKEMIDDDKLDPLKLSSDIYFHNYNKIFSYVDKYNLTSIISSFKPRTSSVTSIDSIGEKLATIEELNHLIPKFTQCPSCRTSNNITNPFCSKCYKILKKDSNSDIHIIIYFHNLGDPCTSMYDFKSCLHYYKPNLIPIFLNKLTNNIELGLDNVYMAAIDEIKEKVKAICNDNFDLITKISFVGYGIGGILIRKMINNDYFQSLLPKFENFISIAVPHLGKTDPNKFRNSIQQLVNKKDNQITKREMYLADDPNLENCQLYKLNIVPTLSVFKKIILISSPQDTVTSYESARIQLSESTFKSHDHMLFEHMVKSMLASVPRNNIIRYDIHFNQNVVQSSGSSNRINYHRLLVSDILMLIKLLSDLSKYF